MNHSAEKYLDNKLNELARQSLQQHLDGFDSKLRQLRDELTKTNVQIVEFESIMHSVNFIENFPIQHAKLEVYLEFLRNSKMNITYSGKRLREEQENLFWKIEELKISNLVYNQNNELKTQVITTKEGIRCNVGSKFLRLAEFLFSSKTCKEVFYPLVGDWREEYINALRKGRIIDAIFILVKNYFSFAYTMIVCSRFGKLIEFIMKVADVIELFNKFSK
jgi:hypothetical protein